MQPPVPPSCTVVHRNTRTPLCAFYGCFECTPIEKRSQNRAYQAADAPQAFQTLKNAMFSNSDYLADVYAPILYWINSGVDVEWHPIVQEAQAAALLALENILTYLMLSQNAPPHTRSFPLLIWKTFRQWYPSLFEWFLDQRQVVSPMVIQMMKSTLRVHIDVLILDSSLILETRTRDGAKTHYQVWMRAMSVLEYNTLLLDMVRLTDISYEPDDRRKFPSLLRSVRSTLPVLSSDFVAACLGILRQKTRLLKLKRTSTAVYPVLVAQLASLENLSREPRFLDQMLAGGWCPLLVAALRRTYRLLIMGPLTSQKAGGESTEKWRENMDTLATTFGGALKAGPLSVVHATKTWVKQALECGLLDVMRMATMAGYGDLFVQVIPIIAIYMVHPTIWRQVHGYLAHTPEDAFVSYPPAQTLWDRVAVKARNLHHYIERRLGRDVCYVVRARLEILGRG